ncbi:hypothetical protein CDL15_Pgr018114 [Punica granatum]|uniref:Uncharacterized protein n=1 Tax=Punica granatum TaxID=22663 RepID=A0A218WIC6_PUNGR|nr:hypothetical protein CDL15_Pgr018114 [Punica granatum]PKI64384.1 hypothetical protein CRG98_015244 [Punica granatum]
MARVGTPILRFALIGFLYGVFMANTVMSDLGWGSVGKLGADTPSPSPTAGDGGSAATGLRPLLAATALSATFVAFLLSCFLELF